MLAKSKGALALALTLALCAGCGQESDTASPSPSAAAPTASAETSANGGQTPAGTTAPFATAHATPKASEIAKPSATPPAKNDAAGAYGDLQVVAHPESLEVLVNKMWALPASYTPDDLVYPDVPFVFNEKNEKRKMRKEAAAALEQLFAAAKDDGVPLAGVSAYRSYATQKALFDSYVRKDGLEKARTYSAVPGTSEHATGLAIDVTGSDGKCAATDCFAGTKEAKWLEDHAAEYGYIIRYPKGKDSITGYQYEPWHIRYVGKDIAQAVVSKGITLEEYFNAVPVAK
ncbi:M15 family metallopeptidase [Paenibacillus athensensis]|uniref:Peptidase M15 n=1 Tax=Paenibacillus athensensis TaxID=1967502 RepID=A0A4Y8PPR8_9BACL|nr:M15 family metallopeptidase [Paenibacillus athensensis]MCD1261690.1 M15 family metallopeptidase [Paenibacillus athensensis]